MVPSQLLRLLGPALLFAFSAAAATGQSVRGTLTDNETGDGIAGARVVLRDTSGTLIHQTTTSTAGEFLLVAARAGNYALSAEHQGYAPLSAITLELGMDEAVEVAVRLSRGVIAIEPLVVTARRRDARQVATVEGARTRYELFPTHGMRRVVMRGDVELRSAVNARDVFDFFPPRRDCLILYWNGALVREPETVGFWMTSPAVYLEALEFYRNYLDAPLGYRGVPPYVTSPHSCSVMALWQDPTYAARERRPWRRFAVFAGIGVFFLLLSL